MAVPQNNSNNERWNNLSINNTDLQDLLTYLFETETPLSIETLARILIHNRSERERKALEERQKMLGKVYLPKEQYAIGEQIAFPQLDWKSGTVSAARQGNNPETGNFNVISVEFEDGEMREFAAELAEHPLNTQLNKMDFSSDQVVETVLKAYGTEIRKKLRRALEEQSDIVRIGGTWFPKSLLIDINQGYLNLAEALLDAQKGGPMSPEELLEQMELDQTDNAKLLEFSLNYAMQEDPRFDEVGTSGKIAWFLRRFEPEEVREVPLYLRVKPDVSELPEIPEDTLKMILSLNDELTPDEFSATEDQITQASIVLTYPHWRTGTLPITPATSQIFPTALETEHVKFTLVDSQNDEKISAWVVRPHRYVYGLREWFEDQNLIPGSIIEITTTEQPGVVKIVPQKKRSNKEWIKTVLVGADGGLVIALLRQPISAGIHDRMAIAVPDVASLDNLWNQRQSKNISLKSDVSRMMAELSKLDNQRHVHFIDLYASLNVIRRTSPINLLASLTNNREFIHVGDNYYNLAETD
jgi:hypothetical protein